MTSDPPRLLDDLSADPALRDDLLNATDVQLAGLDLPAGLLKLKAVTAASAATAGTGMSALGKLGLGAAVATGAVGLWLTVGEPAPPPVVSTQATVIQPQPAEEEMAPSEAESLVDAAASQVEVVPEARPVQTLEDPERVEVSEPTSAEPVRAAPRRASSSARRTVKPAPVKPDDRVLREARTVAEARSSLSRDPARALSLVEGAEKEFPDGQLIEERRALAIRALAALGRLDEAKKRAKAFVSRFGRGAHAAAVQRAIDEAE